MINRKLIIGTESRTPSFKRKILATVRRFADAQQSQLADLRGKMICTGIAPIRAAL
jgi:hypothetical protein